MTGAADVLSTAPVESGGLERTSKGESGSVVSHHAQATLAGAPISPPVAPDPFTSVLRYSPQSSQLLADVLLDHLLHAADKPKQAGSFEGVVHGGSLLTVGDNTGVLQD